MSTTVDDKDAEALMQRMIDEGRLHTKRQRTSTRSSGSLDASRHSGGSACDVASILTAANGCGLNLSIGVGSGGLGGGDLSVKEELTEVNLGQGHQLVPITGSSSSRQFDNLYLAYSAAMQQAAADESLTTSAAGGPEQMMNFKSSQLLAGAAATMQSFAGASVLDGSSVDAQAAQVFLL